MSSSEVDVWFENYDNPMKDVMQRVREVILAADERMEEMVKWSSPTFTYEGNLSSFNPRSKKHASLMFHHGAEIPGDFPHLEGEGKVARTMKFPDQETVEELRSELELIVAAWIAWKSPES